jgi:putative transcriptional regulator
LPWAFVLACWIGTAVAADSIFLVARKDMPDPNFHDSVVLVTRVDGAGGPMGVIINRPTKIPLSGFFPEIEENVRPDEKLHFGGPVARQVVLFLFKAAGAPDDAIEVLDGVYLASDRKLLREILSGEKKVDALRVFVGYAGWAPEQLEGEVSRGDWHVMQPDAKTIFEKKAERIWPELNGAASRVRVRLQTR